MAADYAEALAVRQTALDRRLLFVDGENLSSGLGWPEGGEDRRVGKTCGVSVQLNHTIVSCRDQQRSAAFLSGILSLPPPTRFGPFLVVAADNDVSLDFAERSGPIGAQHYAFLVGDEEFDAAFGRIRDQGRCQY